MCLSSKLISQQTECDVLRFSDISGSFVAIFNVNLTVSANNAISQLETLFCNPPCQLITDCVTVLDLYQLDFLLYSTPQQEIALLNSRVYSVPGFNDLEFAGFAGIEKCLDDCSLRNEVTHPLIINLLEGNFLVDFYLWRIMKYQRIPNCFGAFYTSQVDFIKNLPKFMKPNFTILLLRFLINLLRKQIQKLKIAKNGN